MKKRSSQKQPLYVYARHFAVVALGTSRSEEQVQQEINEAAREALQDYLEDIVQTQPVQGFLAGGLEWLWLFAVLPGAKAAGLGFAGALGKKAGDKLYDLFEKRLRQRNLQTKSKPAESVEKAGPDEGTKSKRQKKSRKS